MSTSPVPAPYREPSKPSPGPVPVPEPPRPRRPSRWPWLAALAAAGLGIALFLALRTDATKTGGGELVQPAPAAAQVVQAKIRISGQTSARNYAQIMVPTFRGPDSGSNLTLMGAPSPGSFVKKGDVVAEFDPQTLLDHVDDVKDQVESAENDVAKKKAQQLVNWSSLQQSIKIAKADWDKAVMDVKAAEVKTAIEREMARLNADEAEAAYKQLLKEEAETKAAHAADLRISEIAVQRQKIHLNNHVIDLERFKIRTPMAGLVVMAQTFRGGETRQVQVGDQLHPGMQIMKVVDLTSMQLEARVSQADSHNFRVGQEAEIGFDAFPGLKFPGRIRTIGAIATKGMFDQYYVRNVPVNIGIEGSDPRLIPDLSAWAFVNTDKQQTSMAASR